MPQFKGSEYQNNVGDSYVVYEDKHRHEWVAESTHLKATKRTKRQLTRWLRKKGYRFVGYTPL